MTAALAGRASLRTVRLVGSRARGTAGPLSDWDFALEADDFEEAARALPTLVEALEPLAHGWDRLSEDERTYMLMLRGGIKVDLIFEGKNEPAPPWEVSAEMLPRLDHHFWDWILWLAAKDQAGKEELVGGQLRLLSEHLLGPLGAGRAPSSVKEALALYLEARTATEARLGVTVPRELGRAVLARLAATGYRVNPRTGR